MSVLHAKASSNNLISCLKTFVNVSLVGRQKIVDHVLVKGPLWPLSFTWRVVDGLWSTYRCKEGKTSNVV